MELLGGRDLTRLLGLLERLGATATVDDFADALTRGIRDLVPCDIASYNEVDPLGAEVLFRCDPQEAVFDGAEALFAEHLAEHPLVMYYHRTGDGCAIKISDFMSLRAFRATGLHREVFRPVGTDHVLAAAFRPPRNGSIVALALHRGSSDFAEHDRVLMDTLRPHLEAAHEAVEGRVLLTRAEQLLEGDGRYLVLADFAGTVRRATADAAAALVRHFGEGTAHLLPEPLRALLRPPAHRHVRPDHVVLTGRRGTLLVRVVERSRTRVMLLLDEGIPTTHDHTIGLSPRETDVLDLVAAGLTNRQIADELGVSALTVKSHLEHIYDKLGVRSRTAAALRYVAHPA